MTRATLASFIVLPLILTGCGEEPAALPAQSEGSGSARAAAWFTELGPTAGVDFVWESGCFGEDRYLPEITGGGAALFDMDNDGDLDLYCVQGGTLNPKATSDAANQLYENLGDGTFRNITAQAGEVDDRGYGMGVAAADFDNDGDIDLYITNVGPNALLQNNGDGTFTDVTAAAGVGHPGWGTSTAFLDYDADGDLDLFLCNYVFWTVGDELTCYTDAGSPDYCSPKAYNAPAPDVLYRNDGNGRFTEVSQSAGIRSSFGNGLGVVVADFNDDHRPDIFVANDMTQNQLWINNGDGTFRDAAPAMGCALDYDGQAKAGMGTDAVDYDNDGDTDLLVVNLTGQSDSFYRHEGTYFTDDTARVGLGGISRPYTRFGVALVDFNNDGWLDVYEANGAVAMPRGERPDDDPFAEGNLLIEGRADGRLTVRDGGGVASDLVHTSRAAAFGDIDNDGRVDIVVINRDGPTYVLRNTVEDAGNSLWLRLVSKLGRDDYNAVVRMNVDGVPMTRYVRAAYSYLASNDPRIHIGLGDASEVTDVEIHWSDGTRESLGTLPAGMHVITQGEG